MRADCEARAVRRVYELSERRMNGILGRRCLTAPGSIMKNVDDVPVAVGSDDIAGSLSSTPRVIESSDAMFLGCDCVVNHELED